MTAGGALRSYASVRNAARAGVRMRIEWSISEAAVYRGAQVFCAA